MPCSGAEWPQARKICTHIAVAWREWAERLRCDKRHAVRVSIGLRAACQPRLRREAARPERLCTPHSESLLSSAEVPLWCGKPAV